MGISPKTVAFLRLQGYEAKRLLEENLERLTDSGLLDKARAEHSIILTNDLDFGELLAASHAALPSVIIFRLHDMSAANVNRLLLKIINEYSQDLADGAVFSVDERAIRVRRLPI
jgi:predicted nuclease of predicted toxin-antitoxin system